MALLCKIWLLWMSCFAVHALAGINANVYTSLYLYYCHKLSFQVYGRNVGFLSRTDMQMQTDREYDPSGTTLLSYDEFSRAILPETLEKKYGDLTTFKNVVFNPTQNDAAGVKSLGSKWQVEYERFLTNPPAAANGKSVTWKQVLAETGKLTQKALVVGNPPTQEATYTEDAISRQIWNTVAGRSIDDQIAFKDLLTKFIGTNGLSSADDIKYKPAPLTDQDGIDYPYSVQDGNPDQVIDFQATARGLPNNDARALFYSKVRGYSTKVPTGRLHAGIIKTLGQNRRMLQRPLAFAACPIPRVGR